MENKIKIAIGLPTNGTIKTKTVHSIFKATKNLPYEWNMISQTGAMVHDHREAIAVMARKLGCTHLLFVDSDMVFDEQIVQKLIDDDKDIVGADYHYKKLPLQSIVKKTDIDGTEIWKEHDDGLAECVALGMGLMLIKLSVFDTLSKPWFWMETKDGVLELGEDMWFCRKAREAGFTIWCDTTLVVKHIGDFEF